MNTSNTRAITFADFVLQNGQFQYQFKSGSLLFSLYKHEGRYTCLTIIGRNRKILYKGWEARVENIDEFIQKCIEKIRKKSLQSIERHKKYLEDMEIRE